MAKKPAEGEVLPETPIKEPRVDCVKCKISHRASKLTKGYCPSCLPPEE